MSTPSAETLRRVKKIRREFHRHPELAFEEVETSRRIREWLTEHGIPFRHPVARTGIVADLSVTDRKPLLAFRADMDALPVEEVDEPARRSYRSTINGLMHACGHDCHLAIMLGVARELSLDSEFCQLAGARFLFQPAEEGGGGARVMIDEGALTNPRPTAIFSCHVSPSLPAGHFGFVAGPAHAATDMMEITITGRGGHAARPEECIDPVVAASSLVMQLQTVVSRSISALDSAVVSIGSIQGGTRCNIIPDTVRLAGTVRTHHPAVRDTVKQRIVDILQGVDLSFGTTSTVFYPEYYPPCLHDQAVTEFLYDTARDLFGPDCVHQPRPSMGGEDFAYFTAEIPGSMVRVGVNNRQKGIMAPCHSCHFDVDEKALGDAVQLFTEAARRWARAQ